MLWSTESETYVSYIYNNYYDSIITELVILKSAQNDCSDIDINDTVSLLDPVCILPNRSFLY